MVCESQRGRGHSEGWPGKDAPGKGSVWQGLRAAGTFPTAGLGALAGNWRVSCRFRHPRPLALLVLAIKRSLCARLK